MRPDACYCALRQAKAGDGILVQAPARKAHVRAPVAGPDKKSQTTAGAVGGHKAHPIRVVYPDLSVNQAQASASTIGHPRKIAEQIAIAQRMAPTTRSSSSTRASRSRSRSTGASGGSRKSTASQSPSRTRSRTQSPKKKSRREAESEVETDGETEEAVGDRKPLLIRRYTPADRDQAVKLVVDNYSERRPLANMHVLKSAPFYAVLVPLVGTVLMQYSLRDDLGTVLLLVSGIVMAALSLVDRLGSALSTAARNTIKSASDFLARAEYAFVAIYGDSIVGVTSMHVVELADAAAADPLAPENLTYAKSGARTRSRAAASPKKGGRKHHGLISSWGVLKRYRGVGLGSDLMEKLLEVAAETGMTSVLIQTSSLERQTQRALQANSFEPVASFPLPGALGWLGVRMETWAVDPAAWLAGRGR
ncbi:uncharacterized protein V1510DRAFT_420007 [Dipodascopsis tothii]|uniref:uncharacterized protein n=1 Tax=Dipodascopsis tothii TaxID=44089 RepID=UPI0034CE62CB